MGEESRRSMYALLKARDQQTDGTTHGRRAPVSWSKWSSSKQCCGAHGWQYAHETEPVQGREEEHGWVRELCAPVITASSVTSGACSVALRAVWCAGRQLARAQGAGMWLSTLRTAS